MLVLRHISQLRPRVFLEIGSGSGDLVLTLAQRGFAGHAFELSPQAMSHILTEARNRRVNVEKINFSLTDIMQTKHLEPPPDLTMAFEVLEHVEDDLGLLTHLTQLTAPGGHVLISVPAHQKQWGATDVWAGHHRRYERQALIQLAQGAGLTRPRVWSYGFPLIVFTHRLRDLYYAQKLKRTSGPAGTPISGLVNPFRARGVSFLGRLYGMVASYLQIPFLGSDLGEGYLLLARKQ